MSFTVTDLDWEWNYKDQRWECGTHRVGCRVVPEGEMYAAYIMTGWATEKVGRYEEVDFAKHAAMQQFITKWGNDLR